MPLYDYYCDKCGTHFELNLTIANRDSECGKTCPCDECDGILSRKLIGAPGLSHDYIGPLKRAGDGFKEVQQKIISTSLGMGHTIRTK